MIYHNSMLELANMDLTGNDRRVLTVLSTMMGYNEPFRYSTNEIAETLGMSAPAVSRCIRRLRDRGLLVNVGPVKSYLHPDFFWRGEEPQRLIALELVKLELEKEMVQ